MRIALLLAIFFAAFQSVANSEDTIVVLRDRSGRLYPAKNVKIGEHKLNDPHYMKFVKLGYWSTDKINPKTSDKIDVDVERPDKGVAPQPWFKRHGIKYEKIIEITLTENEESPYTRGPTIREPTRHRLCGNATRFVAIANPEPLAR